MKSYLLKLLVLLKTTVLKSSNEPLVIRGVSFGKRVEWTLADGYIWGKFLNETDTGKKLKIILEDQIIASALSSTDDKKSYREGLIDMFRSTMSKQTGVEIKNMSEDMKKQFLTANMPKPQGA